MISDVNRGEEGNLIALPLSDRPRIRQAGTGVHGLKREETFLRPSLWAIHLYFWEGAVHFGGEAFQIRPHHLGLTPPGVRLTWRFPLKACPHYFVHFELPGEGEFRQLPVMYPLGVEFPVVSGRLELILANWRGMPCRTEVGLWDLLWHLAEEHESSGPGDCPGFPTIA